jgi:hypothetical protein
MRKFLIATILSLGFFALGQSADAQGSFGYSTWNGSTFGGFSSGFGGGVVWTAPRSSAPAKFDARISPSLIKAAKIADSRAGAHSTLRCWHSVKAALVDAGVVSSTPTTAYANQAGQELVHNYGFVQLHVRDPYDAPVGSVLVYGGGGAGHVELRTPHGFASDYRSCWRCKYPLIGVYAKIAS